MPYDCARERAIPQWGLTTGRANESGEIIVGRLHRLSIGAHLDARGIRPLKSIAVAIAAGAVIVSGLVAPSAALADTAPASTANTPATVSADPLPTVQINGIVWTQAVSGSTVYAGGEFSSARPAGASPGTNETPRSNLLAYDIASGVLISSFNPSINSRVMASAVSPDGARLYIAGAFTSVNGASRYRVAAFDTATGGLIGSWAPGTNGLVNDIKATNTTVYIAGTFTNVNNTARTGVAALSAANGSLLPFNPVLEGGYLARAVEVAPDGSKVIVAGSFLTANGSNNPGRGIGAFDPSSGATLPWAMNSVIRNAGNNAAIYSLASDGDSVYGSGYDFGGTKTDDDFEGAFRASWSDGTLQWMEDCHGDTYSVFPFAGSLYTAAHTHYCGNIGEFPQLNPWYLNHSLAFSKEPSDRKITPDIWGYRSFTGQTAGKLLHWYPTWGTGTVSGVGQAGWDITASGDYLLYGGEFTSVSGVRQQGLVRFAKTDRAPNKIGPTQQGGLYQIRTASIRAGETRISWTANYDADNASLTYQLFRQGTAAPVYSTTADSTYWIRPSMNFADKNLTKGQTYNYRVRVEDPFGNWTTSDWTPVTVSDVDTATQYDEAVIDDAPSAFWPLNETSGTAAYDWAGGSDMVVRGSVTRGVAGQEQTQSATATRFSGSSSFATTTSSRPGPQKFSVEAWFNTTSTSGGKIVGFGSSSEGTSSSYDRHIYINGSGAVSFGVYPGQVKSLTSATGYNNGQWHHVVGTLGPDGISLYIDGRKISSDPSATSAQDYSGYWRIGGDSVSSWPSAGSQYLAGSIADVAVYDHVLTRDDVDAHWVASGRQSAVPPAPADAYGASVYGLDPVLYWRVGESSGSVAKDSGRDGANGVYQQNGGSIARSQNGALAGVSDTAVRLSSSKNLLGTWNNRQTIVSSRSYPSPTAFAVEGWFKTTSSGGGKIVGFGSSSSNNANPSSNYDRHIYMTPSGQLKFGTYNGTTNVLTAPATYRDGAWHHVVGQQSDTGMQLFVDGKLVGSNDVRSADPYTGYWRVGGDTTWEGDPFWAGTVDEIAVYSRALSETEVATHHALGATGAFDAPPTASFTAVPTDLSVAFDASASSDAQGPVVGYDWNFGDGDTASGVTTSHTFDAAGTYVVTLTVRDSAGQTGTTSREVTVVAANVPPVPEFAATADFLSVQVDAQGSTDPDGSITSYSWDFGDGATATGATASHAYAGAGTKSITLTVSDDRGGSAALTKTVDVVAPPVPNQAPTAAFTEVVGPDGMTVSVDGSASSDADGSVTAFAWTFGDGGTATGATASHTYAEPGSYRIELTVTDDDGATAVLSKNVSVDVPPVANAIVEDRFSRSVSSGWGAADVGGTWAVLGGSAAFAVKDGAGTITLSPSQTREARMLDVNVAETVTSFTMTSDAAAVGGTTSLTVTGRQIGTGTYSGRVRLEPNNVVRLYLLRGETLIGDGVALVMSDYTPGTALNVKLSVAGTNPTTLGFKVWRAGASEPDWQLRATDSTAAMQGSGFIGLKAASSSVSTTPKIVLSVDDLVVVGAPTPNALPVAQFTSSVNGLSVQVDGSGSSDAEGPVTHAWSFGDGATASGATSAHTYAQAGTYTVTLTVTDGSGATAVKTEQVTVTGGGGPANQPPVAEFAATSDGLSVLVDASASSDADGEVVGYSWDFGDGGTASGVGASHVYTAPGTYPVTLTVVDDDGASTTRVRDVVATNPGPAVEPIAADAFERSVTGGWGTADAGGAWTTTGGAAAFSVGGGKGIAALSPAFTREVRLNGVSSADSTVELTLASETASAGGVASATVIGRQVGSSMYSARMRFEANGQVRLYLMRDETLLGGKTFTLDGSYTAGEPIRLRLRVAGSSPTTTSAKIWRPGAAEPAGWQIEAVDSTAALQSPGTVGVRFALSSASTNAVQRILADDLVVTAGG